MTQEQAVKVKANVTIDVGVLLFPDDILEFSREWIIVRQIDIEQGMTTGVFYHIRKRKPEDPATVMTESLEEK